MSTNSQPWALMSPSGDYYRFCQPNFFVGREEDLDLTLKSRSVDKRHAVITIKGNRHEIHDLGSLNGTFVNERRIKRLPVQLGLRDTIRFGYDMNTYRIDLYPQQHVKPFVEIYDENHNNKPHVNPQSEPVYNAQDGYYQQEQANKTSCEDNGNREHLATPAYDVSYHAHPASYPMHHQVVPHHPAHYTPHTCSTSCHPPVSPRQSHCSCPQCIRGPEPHSPHGSPADHMVPGYYGYHGYPPYYGHVVTSVGHERPTIERPMSVHGDRYDTMVKGSPLYGQPPWWGWSCLGNDAHQSAEPHAVAIQDRGEAISAHRVITLRKPKLRNEGTPSQRPHSTGTAAVLEESLQQSQEKTFTQMAQVSHNPWQNHRVASPLNSSHSKEPLPVMYKGQDTGQWEYMAQTDPRINSALQFEDCELEDNSINDKSVRQTRRSLSFEIPIIPEYGEIPEKPVSEKSSERHKNDVKVKTDKRSIIRSKTITKSKSKQRPMSDTETCYRTKKGSGRRYSTTSLVSDTSESECDRSFRGRHDSPVTLDNSVFGLTEVSFDRISESSQNRPQSSSMVLPKWVEHWARAMKSENGGVDLSSKFDAGSTHEGSTSPHTSTPTDVSRGRTRGSSTAADSTNESRSSTPRSTRYQSSTGRSQSTVPSPPKHSDSKSATLPRTSRSRTHAVSRLRMSTGSDVESRKSLRSRGMMSSTSDDSDGERSDTSFSSSNHLRTSGYSTPDRDGSIGRRRSIPRPTSAPVTLPRGNKTTMLRAQNSREAIKSSSTKPNTAKTKHSRHSSVGSPAEEKVSSISSTRLWTQSNKKGSKSPSSTTGSRKAPSGSSDTEDITRTKGLSKADLETQAAVDALFCSTRSSLPDDFQMSRSDKTNKTFVLDDDVQQTGVSSSEEVQQDNQPNERNLTRNVSVSQDNDKDGCSPKLDRESLIKALTDLQMETPKTSPPPNWSKSPDLKTETPPNWSKSPDLKTETPPNWSKSRDLKTETSPGVKQEGRQVSQDSKRDYLRPVSPDSLVSVPPVSSPSPPSTPRSSAKKVIQSRTGNGSAVSQSRRHWDVTEKPVEDLMLASIHAFTVELRLASESALSKVRTLYEKDADGTNRVCTVNCVKLSTSSDDKQENLSSIPDWKSSHAEIAGVFRNLRKVEFSLRTMDQALSVLCTNPTIIEPQKERKLSVIEQPNKSPHKWKDFKVRARRSSWAVEHRDKFPDLPSDDEDDDTS